MMAHKISLYIQRKYQNIFQVSLPIHEPHLRPYLQPQALDGACISLHQNPNLHSLSPIFDPFKVQGIAIPLFVRSLINERGKRKNLNFFTLIEKEKDTFILLLHYLATLPHCTGRVNFTAPEFDFA